VIATKLKPTCRPASHHLLGQALWADGLGGKLKLSLGFEMNRRLFVLATGGAGFALADGSNDRVATAIIGTGNRGSYLLRGVLQQTNAKVVALCDNKPERLDRAATTAAKDNPKTYKDWRALLDDKDVEAVYISTPPYLHS
jgi:hypothetical protein